MKAKTNSPVSLRRAPGATCDVLFQLAIANRAMADTLNAYHERLVMIDDQLLANIGHELRTPLTIIQGLSEIMLDDVSTGRLDADTHRDFLYQIHRASVALSRLVENSIMLTKINSGHLQLNLQPLHIGEAIERVISQYTDEVAAKQLKVLLETSPDLVPVWADGFCLELSLQALYDNAIKFNHPNGKIHWKVWRDHETIHVAIADTGVGIPPEKLPELFTVFGQLESGPTRRFGGLGLGLPLVRKLLESFGGTINAQSPGPNQGSTFTFVLAQAPVLS